MTNIFENYLIASDMDGTFLGSETNLIENNLKAIKYFTANGGLFALATGRCRSALKKLFPEVSDYVNTKSIICGGAYLYDFNNDEFFSEKTIEFDSAKTIIETVKAKFPDIGVRISFQDGYVCPVFTEYLKKDIDKHTPGIIKSLDMDFLLGNRIHKIVYSAEKEKIAKLNQFAEEHHFEGVQYTTSSDKLLEMLPIDATKGTALSILKENFAKNRKIIAVGDYLNDMAMLEACDIPACPDNACDKVKEATKVHLCNNNQGCIADLIYKLENKQL